MYICRKTGRNDANQNAKTRRHATERREKGRARAWFGWWVSAMRATEKRIPRESTGELTKKNMRNDSSIEMMAFLSWSWYWSRIRAGKRWLGRSIRRHDLENNAKQQKATEDKEKRCIQLKGSLYKSIIESLEMVKKIWQR